MNKKYSGGINAAHASLVRILNSRRPKQEHVNAAYARLERAERQFHDFWQPEHRMAAEIVNAACGDKA